MAAAFRCRNVYISVLKLPFYSLVKRSHHLCYPYGRRLTFYASDPVPRQIIPSHSVHASKYLCGKVVPFVLSDIGEGIREVELKEWFVKVGDHIEQFENVCEVKSDKASVTITSRFDGVVTKLHYDIDDVAQVGKPLIDVELDGNEAESVASHQKDQGDVVVLNLEAQQGEQLLSPKVLATPAVRRICMENNVRLSDVIGTGKDGRVLKEDIMKFLKMGGAPLIKSKILEIEEVVPPSNFTSDRSAAQAPLPTIQRRPSLLKNTTEPIKGMRRAMVKTMTNSLKIPHFGYFDEVNVSNLTVLREKLKDSMLERGVKFSLMPIFIKACSIALLQFPILNSSINDECTSITYKAAHNIGFAMASPDGLIVPNIKNVEGLSLFEVAVELNRLIQLGQSGKLGTHDLTEGTFTLSNIGTIGGTYAKAIILPPEVAIGALGKVQIVPRFDDTGNVIKASIMQVSWSADHRVIDGATMARFSNLWKSYLESPASMIVDMK